MNQFTNNTAFRSTPSGQIRIQPFCTPGEIRSCEFDNRFTVYPEFTSIYTQRESLEQEAEQADTNVVLALTENRKIVGFGVLGHPDTKERWSGLGKDTLMEIKAIEVSRPFRSCHIAKDLLRLMLAHPKIENMIVFMVGLSWTWDQAGTGLKASAYRGLLTRLFRAYGFIEFKTNEGNISLDPENLFMGRIGSRVSAQTEQDFKWLRFGIYPENTIR